MSSSEDFIPESSPSKAARYSDKRSAKGKDRYADKEKFKEKAKFKDKSKLDDRLTRESAEKDKATTEKYDLLEEAEDTGSAKKEASPAKGRKLPAKLATAKTLKLFREKRISDKAEEEKRELLKVKTDKFAIFIADKEGDKEGPDKEELEKNKRKIC